MKGDLYFNFVDKKFYICLSEHKMRCGALFVRRNAKILFKNWQRKDRT